MHNDFTGRNPIRVTSVAHKDSYLLAITQAGGGMYFQHAMTPAQARQLASTLVQMANDIEPVRVQVEEVEA